MDLTDYQKKTYSTWLLKDRPSVEQLMYLTLGLTSEAGEVAGKIKKLVRDGDLFEYGLYNLPHDKQTDLFYELGDVLWYIARLSKLLGFDLSVVAQGNINKLEKRNATNTLHGSGDHRENSNDLHGDDT